MTTNDVCEVCGKSQKRANGDFKCWDMYDTCKNAQDIAITRAAEIERLRGVVEELRGALLLVLEETGRECYCDVGYFCGRCFSKQAIANATKEPHE